MNRSVVGAAAALSLAIAACGGGTTGTTTRTLSPAERQALAAALLNSPQMGAYGPVASQALVFVADVGQLSIVTDGTPESYNGVGLWMDINATHDTAAVVTQFFALLAWQGTGSTITKLTVVMGTGNNTPVTDSLTTSFNPVHGGMALFGGAPFGGNDVYVSSQGTFTTSSAEFSGSTNFTQGSLSGSYSYGTLGGHYFAQGANAALAVRQQTGDFSSGLPAVRLVVRGSF
jgi:hypothetical protein